MSFGIRSRAHNNFASAQPDGRLEIRPSIAGDWEKFTLEPSGAGVAIRTSHGYYLSAQPDGRIEKRPSVGGAWEQFRVTTNGDGTVSFGSVHGKYLCNEGSTFVWNRPSIGPWESFDLVPAGGHHAPPSQRCSIRSRAHHNFASAQPDGRLEIRPSVGGDWEKFTFEPSGAGVAIRTSHGYYLSAQPDGRIEKRPSVGGAWEQFQIVRNGDGSSSLRSVHGTFLCNEGSSFVWNRHTPGPWESFDLLPVF